MTVSEETLSYIRQHRLDDPRKLALQSRPDGVDIRYALEQIAGWQSARHKLPQWADTDGVVFPPHLSMEQCSSQLTAIYKRNIVDRLIGKCTGKLVDLTGGFGVDFSYMAQAFKSAVYVERQQILCDAAQHNMPLLGLDNVEIVCGDGEDYLQGMDHAFLIFLDPARRDANGGRTYGIADCTPDVASLQSLLRMKSDFVMVKLSPMLDWHKAVEEMDGVIEVHIVSVRNECKELLLVIDSRTEQDRQTNRNSRLSVFCINFLSEDGKASIEEFHSEDGLNAVSATFCTPAEEMYIFEPNASVMKFGRFGELCGRYDVKQIAPNSNLFVAATDIENFPGRRFVVNAVSGFSKKELHRILSGIDKSNIATRNFPISVAELRKRLKIKEGGDTYIFATTFLDGSHKLLVCKRVG